MPRAYRYILRYSIDPLFHAQDRIAELVAFCRASRVDEVMLFFLAEELTTGHPTAEECEPWIGNARRLKQALAERGIGLSLNPWSTLYHVPRGRRFKPGQPFMPMVGETGAASPVVACPLCPAWQAYLCDLFALWAREVRPAALWVEDDWRLHNHGEALGYGGCFCPRHLERFGARVGEAVTRESLLERLLAPGAPHPWRGIWLELCRDSILEPARRLAGRLRAEAPGMRLALMSSNPDVHSIEGRDWGAFQEILGREPAFLIRPHLPPYTEVSPIDCPPAVTRHTIACLDGPLEIYPELENSPRCGPYSKSAAYSVWECFQSACLGAAGITVNHFDMMGNGTALDPHFGAALARARPMLDALAALEIDDRRAQGVQVLFHPQVAAHLHAGEGSSLAGLDARSAVWGRTLSILGIAHGYRKILPQADCDPRARPPFAVCGQTLRAFSDEALRALLSGPLLLDACSAQVLCERGFGPQIGVRAARWAGLEETAFAYESILEDDPAVYGVARPRMTASRCAGRMLAMEPSQGAEELSAVCRADRQPLFPGSLRFRNALGGTVLTFAYPFDGRQQFFMGYFNAFRRIFLQREIFRMADGAPLAAAEERPMHLYRAATREGELLAAFNVLYDRQERVVLRVSGGPFEARQARRLQPDGVWAPCPLRIEEEGATKRFVVEVDLAPLEGLYLLFPRNGPSPQDGG